MRKLLLGTGLFTIITLLSCQREISEPNDPGSPQDEKTLLKVSYNQQHRTFIDSFVYDGQNRCSRFFEIIYDSTITPNPEPYISYYDFYYNGAEIQPYKITDTSEGREMIWLIQYDVQHRKTVDSILYINTGEKQVSSYNYTGNNIVANTNFVSSGGTTTTSMKDTFDFAANNCARYAGFVQQSGYPIWWQYSVTYDTRVNPLGKLNIANSVLFGANGTLGDFRGINKNNPLTATFSNSGGNQSTTMYQYIYDADGYPLSSTFYTVGDPSLNGSVMYDYRN